MQAEFLQEQQSENSKSLCVPSIHCIEFILYRNIFYFVLPKKVVIILINIAKRLATIWITFRKVICNYYLGISLLKLRKLKFKVTL